MFLINDEQNHIVIRCMCLCMCVCLAFKILGKLHFGPYCANDTKK